MKSDLDARIAKLRMGDITVKTRPGSEVRIQQLRHEFLFGTAITDQLPEKHKKAVSSKDRKMFLKILGENFNYAVHENALKWYDCEVKENRVDYYLADRIWEFCSELNIPMRGHCVFWDKDEYIMPWLDRLNNEHLHAAVVRRALDVTKHFKGRISEFDLNNEMVHNDYFRRRLGYGIINEMAWLVKSANPDAVLFVNEYGILCDGGFNLGPYITQIKNLIASGVPIGGIGCQGHQGTPYKSTMSAEHVQKALDLLSQFGLPLKVTEALFDAENEEAQAEEMKKIFPVYFAHPNVEAILIWGFWAGAHWQPWTALWRKDWTITPQGEVFRDFVFNKWWTRVSGSAEKNGTFKTRAFYGDYSITSDGKTKKVTLSKKNKTLEAAF